MKQPSLYGEGIDKNDADYFKPSFSSVSGSYITKRELQEYQDQLRIQKEDYERRNQTILSDEIKRTWRS